MTTYDSIERDAADVVERRHRRTFTLTQLLVACVAACCCALAATTVGSTHREGWGFIRRPAPRRPVHFVRVPSADERLKTCESDLKVQKDESEAALKASEARVKELRRVAYSVLNRFEKACIHVDKTRQYYAREARRAQGKKWEDMYEYYASITYQMQYEFGDWCRSITLLDKWYDYNLTHVASEYEYQPIGGDLYKFVQRE